MVVCGIESFFLIWFFRISFFLLYFLTCSLRCGSYLLRFIGDSYEVVMEEVIRFLWLEGVMSANQSREVILAFVTYT